MAAVALLAVFVIILAWHFLGASATTFVPGPGVDANTFKDTFTTASRVLIVMDVRGAANDSVSHNVLQCGVDFSGSSGMGGKNVTHMSLSKDGCVADDGDHTVEYCISQLKDGVVIYVQPGASSSYYSDALVVGVGAQYAVGSCAIKRA
jgi:hypothetical protein